MMIRKRQNRNIMVCMLVLIPLVFMLMHGCGGDTGISSFTITSLNGTGGAPTVGADNCYQVVVFIVKDVNGNPVDGIRVEVTSNGLVAEHVTANPVCQYAADPTATNGVVLYTKTDGTISVEFIFSPTATGQTGFIYVTSGAATPALWETADSV